MPEVRVEFVPERTTKNTVRFREIDNNAGVDEVIGPLYIKKVALASIQFGTQGVLVVILQKEVK